MFKKVALFFLATCGYSSLWAQNNTSSPYTRFGYGELCDAGFGYVKSLGGGASALRNSRYINPGNPASYTAIDSMGFRFEFGTSFKRSSFSDNDNSQVSWDANIDYLALQFPVTKWMGFSMGLQPYSFVGYEFGNTTVTPSSILGDTLATTNSYNGSGDITQLYFGLGVNPVANLNLGINVYYNFGSIDHVSEVTFNNANYHPTTQTSTISVHDWSVGLGAQYVFLLGNERKLTWGATVDFKSNLSASASKEILTTAVDTVNMSYDNTFDLPFAFGTGLAYNFNESWMVDLDYKYQKWSDVRYFNQKDFSDRNRFSAGLEYLPNKLSKFFYQRVSYRVGLGYSNSYYKVNDKDFNQMVASFGLGLPLRRTANPTILNLGVEYGRAGKTSDSLILEQYFKFTLNLVVNEKWFAKRKFE